MYNKATKKYTFDNIEEWIMENDKCEIGIKILIANRLEKNVNFDKNSAVELGNKYGMHFLEIKYFKN